MMMVGSYITRSQCEIFQWAFWVACGGGGTTIGGSETYLRVLGWNVRFGKRLGQPNLAQKTFYFSSLLADGDDELRFFR